MFQYQFFLQLYENKRFKSSWSSSRNIPLFQMSPRWPLDQRLPTVPRQCKLSLSIVLYRFHKKKMFYARNRHMKLRRAQVFHAVSWCLWRVLRCRALWWLQTGRLRCPFSITRRTTRSRSLHLRLKRKRPRYPRIWSALFAVTCSPTPSWYHVAETRSAMSAFAAHC